MDRALVNSKVTKIRRPALFPPPSFIVLGNLEVLGDLLAGGCLRKIDLSL